MKDTKIITKFNIYFFKRKLLQMNIKFLVFFV